MRIHDNLENSSQPPGEGDGTQRKWRPLSANQRRVAGVMVEKAKTTPEQYPLSLNALTTGCNQKSNRSPQMNLDATQVEQTLDELREMGAVVEIQSGGRVAKYKHLFYDWLGVEKAELAVMAELLLRGEQTVGELRGRAARMEPIADLGTLRPILRSLVDKGLVVELTPEGRGQVVTHALYNEARLAKLRDEYRSGVPAKPAAPQATRAVAPPSEDFAVLQAEVAELRQELQQLKQQVQQLQAELGSV
jgi:uncharacterized protein YceH (UPF0502 family)